MSLLMKALASAEKEKKEKEHLDQEILTTENSAVELALEPTELSVLKHSNVHNDDRVSQKAAANIFTANQYPKSHASKAIWALLFLASGLIVWFGWQFYQLNSNTPEVLMAQKSAPKIPAKVNIAPETAPQLINHAQINNQVVDQQAIKNVTNSNLVNQSLANPNQENTNQQKAVSIGNQSTNNVLAQDTLRETALFEKKNNPSQQKLHEGDAQVKSNAQTSSYPVTSITPIGVNQTADAKTSSIRLTTQKSIASVDPILLSAYQAFSRGENKEAQQQYRQVLQKDVRNIDALLGMAAIAQRQSRDADAGGWYQKVLEIEPQNTTALSAMLNSQPSLDDVSQISRLKNLIAQQPEVASFHAALGNLYATQNQWLPAQEAYFNANRYASNNADYAFNLAVSLDQLGKPSLALVQYQRALALVQQSGASSPNKSSIEARIQTLQQ